VTVCKTMVCEKPIFAKGMCYNDYMSDWKSKQSDEWRFRQSLRHNAGKWGLDPDVVEASFNAHDGKCDICGGEQTYRNKMRLAMDHDHKTGELRGWLCDRCNNGIGHFGDDTELLRKAIAYLKERQ
jgi:Recombination endonuclease VII